ncbi:signal peptidase II [Lacinutrix salivirga]
MNRTVFIVLLIAINIALDQVTKYFTRVHVAFGSTTEIIGDYLTLHNVENSGAFLGLGSDLGPALRIVLLLVLPIAVLGLVLLHIFRDKGLDKLTLVGFCCIIGGGLANIYDRIVYGSVTDMFHIDLGGVFRTGIFNVADMSVMFGMGCLIVSNFRSYKKQKSSE